MNTDGQIELFESNTSINSNHIALNMADIIISGFHWLQFIANKKERIHFHEWANVFQGARQADISVDRLIWLWDTIISEPGTKKMSSCQLVSLDEDWKAVEPIECLQAGSKFGIFFRKLNSYGYPTNTMASELTPDVKGELGEPLSMKPGKARRLECGDAITIIEIKPNEIGTKREESVGMKVDERCIDIENDTIQVQVKSLNHAYTTASLRLQENRRSHGGRIYDHIAFVLDDGVWKTLDAIRIDAEKIARYQMLNKGNFNKR